MGMVTKYTKYPVMMTVRKTLHVVSPFILGMSSDYYHIPSPLYEYFSIIVCSSRYKTSIYLSISLMPCPLMGTFPKELAMEEVSPTFLVPFPLSKFNHLPCQLSPQYLSIHTFNHLPANALPNICLVY